MISEAQRQARALAKMDRKAIADSRKARAVHEAELKVRTRRMLLEIIGLFIVFGAFSALIFFILGC